MLGESTDTQKRVYYSSRNRVASWE